MQELRCSSTLWSLAHKVWIPGYNDLLDECHQFFLWVPELVSLTSDSEGKV